MVKSKPKLRKKFLLNEDNKLLLQVLDKENKTACKLSIKIFCNFLFAENSFEQATKTNCCEGFRFWMCSRPNRPQVNMVVTILSRWRNPHITTFQNHRNIILACPRYNVEEMAEDSAFSMTTAFKDDNNLEICAKVCPAWDLRGHANLTKLSTLGPGKRRRWWWWRSRWWPVNQFSMIKGLNFVSWSPFMKHLSVLHPKSSGWEAVEPSSLVEKSTLVQKVERYLENTLIRGKYF